MRSTLSLFALAVFFLASINAALAQGYSLLSEGSIYGARAPLVAPPLSEDAPQPLIRARAEIPETAASEAARAHAQSLFIGRASRGLFAPPAARDGAPSPDAPAADETTTDETAAKRDPQIAMLLDLIARAEAGRDGYDAVQHGAKRRPARAPTQMTLGEIFAWIEATPNQPHAIGRYQFIPPTLARLVEMAGATADDRFSPELQDRLADILLMEAGLDRYRAGALSRRGFMNNLAKIWAGLPNSSGRSHYHGYAGNAATMSWSRFQTEMARIFES